MINYINLSVKLSRTSEIKEALIPYRSLTQTHNTSSLDAVLIHYRNEVEKVFEAGIVKYDLKIITSIPDFEMEEPPEDLMVLALNPENKKNQDKIKQLLRLLWDTYKNIIETIKINKKLEDLYISTIEKTLGFSEKYKRKSELHKFMELQKNNLQQLILREVNFQKFPNHTDITNSETNDKYISIRLSAYKVAKKLGLWQDCFKMLEDIQTLIFKRKGQGLRNRSWSLYFENLAEVFLQSFYYNYHAVFFFHHYTFFKKNPTASKEDMRSKIDMLILGVLSIGLYNQEKSSEENRDRITQLLSVINVKQLFTREEIIKNLKLLNIIEQASPEIQQIFQLMEEDINLFTYSKQVEPILTNLRKNNQYQIYINQIEENLVYKVLSSISSIYKTIKIDNVFKILSFVGEKKTLDILLKANVTNFLQCRIDQNKKIIVFLEKRRTDFIDASQKIISFSQNIKMLSNKINPIPKQQAEKQKKQERSDLLQYIDQSEQVVGNRLAKTLRQKREMNVVVNTDLKKKQWIADSQEQDLVNKETEQRIHAEKMLQLANERLRSELKQKKEKIKEIVKIKRNQIAKIEGQKIEDLDDDELKQIPLLILEELKNQIILKQKEDSEKKYKNNFSKYDFIERERRSKEKEIIKKKYENQENRIDEIIVKSKERFDANNELKKQCVEAKSFKDKWTNHIFQIMNKRYTENLEKWKTDLEEEYKQDILKEAIKMREEEKAKEEIMLKERKIEEERIRNTREKDQEGKFIQQSDWIISRSNLPKGAQMEEQKGREQVQRPEDIDMGFRNKPRTMPVNQETGRVIPESTGMMTRSQKTQPKPEVDMWKNNQEEIAQSSAPMRRGLGGNTSSTMTRSANTGTQPSNQGGGLRDRNLQQSGGVKRNLGGQTETNQSSKGGGDGWRKQK